MNYRLTMRSSNTKTGPIPVSITTRASCWEGCAFHGAACYAEGFPLRLHWDDVTNGNNATDIDGFCAQVRQIPHGALWRHNQAGDLPGEGAEIDVASLRKIVTANKGRRGFTYTHKPLTPQNVAAVREANAHGFTINVSANSAREAAAIRKQHPDLPLVCVLPHDHKETRIDVDGLPVVTCPAALHENISCATCGLCQKTNRPYAVGFPAHGVRKKAASAIAAL